MDQRSDDKTFLQVILIIVAVCVVNDNHFWLHGLVVSKVSVVNIVSDKIISGVQSQRS